MVDTENTKGYAIKTAGRIHPKRSRKCKNPRKEIIRINNEALEHGLTYGQYVAKLRGDDSV